MYFISVPSLSVFYYIRLDIICQEVLLKFFIFFVERERSVLAFPLFGWGVWGPSPHYFKAGTFLRFRRVRV